MSDDQFKQNVKDLIKSKFPHVADEDIDLHHDSSFYWGPENYSNAAEWVMKTLLIIRNPDQFHNEYLFTNFFGVIDDSELAHFLKGKTTKVFKLFSMDETAAVAFIAAITDKPMREHMERIWEAKNLVEAIRQDFSEDEKFLLRFIRHRYCHITLSRFGVRIEGENDEFEFKTANWTKLVELSKTKTVSSFRAELIDKLKIHESSLERLHYLIYPEPGVRLFAD